MTAETIRRPSSKIFLPYIYQRGGTALQAGSRGFDSWCYWNFWNF